MYKNRKFLVVGGCGLIGSAAAERFAHYGAEVIVADIKASDTPHPSVEYRHLDVLKKDALGKLIEQVHPDVIVNTVNVATLFSHHPHQGYEQIVSFYIDLYRSLRALSGSIHYIQVGTTGSGGLGFNIPFTHGDKIEELPIINKAAFAGITTAMLTLLSRSFVDDRVRISELKPGLAIFGDTISEKALHGAHCVTVDGGESGHYTYDETALLTQFMGFTNVSRIIDALMVICKHQKETRELNPYDVIDTLNSTIVAADDEGNLLKQKLLVEMKERQGKEYVIATGNLGPPSVTRDLILGYLMSEGVTCQDNRQLKDLLSTMACVRTTLEYIKKTHPGLHHYLRAECSFRNYELLQHYYRPGAEPWQVAAASLSKTSPIY